MFCCESGNICCFRRHASVSGEGGDICEFALVPGAPAEPVQPSSRGFVWLSVCAPRDLGPGQRNREGVLRSTDHARAHFVPMLLFPGDKQALGMGVPLSGYPSAPRSPMGAKALALPHSLFLRKSDTPFWTPVCLWCKVYGLRK